MSPFQAGWAAAAPRRQTAELDLATACRQRIDQLANRLGRLIAPQSQSQRRIILGQERARREDHEDGEHLRRQHSSRQQPERLQPIAASHRGSRHRSHRSLSDILVIHPEKAVARR